LALAWLGLPARAARAADDEDDGPDAGAVDDDDDVDLPSAPSGAGSSDPEASRPSFEGRNDPADRADRPPVEIPPDAEAGGRTFAVREELDTPRSVFWLPFFSFWLPGLGQWTEGQYAAGAVYTGVALAGYAYSTAIASADHVADKMKREKDENEDGGGFSSKDDDIRKYYLGTLVAQGAGGLSAYHTFRTSVRTHRQLGEYAFLKHEETPGQLLLAPFHFQYLTRLTTILPLAIGAGLGALIVSSPPEDYRRVRLTRSDAAFSAAYSYNAGTHEEAVFRGWLMPLMRESWGSDGWSNAAQAVLFALAHLNTNSTPVPQLLLGYHLGYVTQKNEWQLSESIFIHAWWDVFAFASEYMVEKTKKKDASTLEAPPLPIWLPALTFVF
jgi:membrane protease YdiL (CAAX protease family)